MTRGSNGSPRLTPRSGVSRSVPPESICRAAAPPSTFFARASRTMASMRERSIIRSPSSENRGVSGPRREFAIVHEVHLLEPGLELGRGAQTHELAERRVVVERGRLVVEHDVVAHGQAHE